MATATPTHSFKGVLITNPKDVSAIFQEEQHLMNIRNFTRGISFSKGHTDTISNDLREFYETLPLAPLRTVIFDLN